MHKSHETKDVKLKENPFLLGLTRQGMVYQHCSPDTVIKVTAAEGFYGEWAAYFETPYTPFRNVLDYGNKLPEEVAAALFPEWTKKNLKWRP